MSILLDTYIITIGSATRDALFRSRAFKIMESRDFPTGRALAMELGTKIPADEVYFTTGGAGTNTAVAFARQGFKTAVIARIGKDVSGAAIKEELEKENVATNFFQEDSELKTAYSVILEHESGERTILVYRGANDALSPEEIPWDKLETKWLYLSSLSANVKFLEKAVELKNKRDVFIAWNPGGKDLALGLEKLQPFLKYIDVLILNQEEVSALLGIDYNKTSEVFKKFDELIAGVAVMTRGPKGVMVSDGKTLWDAATFPEKKVVDRTGAGDSFGSGFVAGLIRKAGEKTGGEKFSEKTIEYALRLASANATSKVENIGAKGGLLTKEEFEESKRWKNLPFHVTILG